MKPKRDFNKSLQRTTEDNLGRLSVEGVVKMAGPGLKRRRKGSKDKLPLTQVRFARSLVLEVRQSPALSVTIKHLHP